MAKILILDDSEKIKIMVQHALTEHELVLTSTLQEAESAVDPSIDLYIIDLNLPDGNGMGFISYLSSVIPEAKKLIFSASDSVNDRVMGFQLGIEDFLIKPINIRELKVRIEARLKKQPGLNSLVFGRLSINPTGRVTKIGDETVDLTPHEFNILNTLASRPGTVFSRDQIIESAWGNGENITDRVVDIHISNLRKKIGEFGAAIKTIYGAGYKFEYQEQLKKSA